MVKSIQHSTRQDVIFEKRKMIFHQGRKLNAKSKTQKTRELFLFIWTAVIAVILVGGIILSQDKGELFEIGDFAATSLLVQDAKQHVLTQGHYSRVGFNHPGPAIIYAFTAGEVIFHDWLRIAESPIAGQALGVACYDALWLAMCCVLLLRITKRSSSAIFLLAAFACFSEYLAPQQMFGMWFPYPVYMPFATFLLALSRLCLGKTDSLYATAISCGFLWHGHVSFLPMTAVMVAIAVLCNLASRDSGWSFSPGKLSNFLVTHWKAQLKALCVLALFLIPLVVRTIRESPGPLKEYASYSGGGGNSLIDAVGFVLQYWGKGWSGLLIFFAVMLLTIKAAVYRSELEDFLGVTGSVVAASAALLFYALFGVDHLDFNYIGMFYLAAPALLFAIGSYVIAEGLFLYIGIQSAGLIKLACAIAFSLAAADVALRSPDRSQAYLHDPAIPRLYEQMRHLGGGRVVLNLVEDGNWENLWFRLVGIQAYAKRRGDSPFCIDANWHILFTKEVKCTDGDVAALPRFAVSGTSVPPNEDRDEAVSDVSPIRFDPCVEGAIHRGEKMQVAASDDRRRFSCALGTGWSHMESEMVWSNGDDAVLRLVLPADENGNLWFDVGAFLGTEKSVQNVVVSINNSIVAKWTFDSSTNRGTRNIPIPADASGVVSVHFHIERPQSPQRLHVSRDTRRLGLALYGLGVN